MLENGIPVENDGFEANEPLWNMVANYNTCARCAILDYAESYAKEGWSQFIENALKLSRDTQSKLESQIQAMADTLGLTPHYSQNSISYDGLDVKLTYRTVDVDWGENWTEDCHDAVADI